MQCESINVKFFISKAGIMLKEEDGVKELEL